MSHPFGDLLHQHLHRRRGLTQSRLAEGILQDPAVISNMCRGRRLIGAQARERVVAIVGWLYAQAVLSDRTEADALLNAAGLVGLQAEQPEEAALLAKLSSTTGIAIETPAQSAAFTELGTTSPKSPPSSLPQPTTPFVGRHRELAQLMDRLSQPECRLLSLVGPGGFGKTRLGIRVGELVLARPVLAPDGVFFVALDGLEGPAWVVPAIAATLNYTFHEQDEPESQLLRYLSQKRILLILDNAEGILDADLVLRLLSTAPQLKLLVTTREALNVREEWFHPIAGMGLSDGDDSVADTDAIEFFVRCARRAQPNFQPAHEHAHVEAICRTVGGVPLAIELAAAWLKGLTCQQVAIELSQGIDILTASMHDVPERHRSLRAVLEQSWRHLAGEEQHVFRRLSIFRGGFLSDAAQAAAETSLPVLLSLVDKSVLQLGQDGRYRIHPLLRQMGEERLAADAGEHATVSARHSAYYLNFLRDRQETVSGPNQRRVLLEVQAEMDNIRRAWRYAARHGNDKGLEDALPCLFRFLWVRGRYVEGDQMLAEALEASEREPRCADKIRFRILLLARRALCLAAIGEFEQATTMLSAAKAHVDLTKRTPEQVLCLYVTGMIYTYDYAPDAYAPLKAAYESYQALGDAPAAANTGVQLAFIVSWMFGDFATGRTLLNESLSIFRELGDLAGIGDALSSLASIHQAYGNFSDAEACLRECLQLADDIDDPLLMWQVKGAYSEIAYDRSQIDLAIRMAQERLAGVRLLGHEHETRISIGLLGNYYVGTGRYDSAIKLYDDEARFSTASLNWGEQALIAVGRFAEAFETLPNLAADISEGRWRYYTIDNLTSWAMLLASECELMRDGERLTRSARTQLARTILILARNYDPDRSRAVSRARAAKLLADLNLDDGSEASTALPASIAQRTAQEIARTLLTIRLGPMQHTHID